MSDLEQAVAEYRAACDAVQPAWDAFASRYSEIGGGKPESRERYEARMEYMRVQGRIAMARKRIIELALDGRSEVPR